jgi:hypothetical protein
MTHQRMRQGTIGIKRRRFLQAIAVTGLTPGSAMAQRVSMADAMPMHGVLGAAGGAGGGRRSPCRWIRKW